MTLLEALLFKLHRAHCKHKENFLTIKLILCLNVLMTLVHIVVSWRLLHVWRRSTNLSQFDISFEKSSLCIPSYSMVTPENNDVSFRDICKPWFGELFYIWPLIFNPSTRRVQNKISSPKPKQKRKIVTVGAGGICRCSYFLLNLQLLLFQSALHKSIWEVVWSRRVVRVRVKQRQGCEM